jgi:hypothetical protein
MDYEGFAQMIGMKDYKKVDIKTHGAKKIRNLRKNDMEEIYLSKSEKKLKRFEFLFEKFQFAAKDEFETCQTFVKKKPNYGKIRKNVFSKNSNKNQQGAFLYKGDHVWTYYLDDENDKKMTFLMIKSEKEQCTFRFLHRFEMSTNKNEDYNNYLTEITDKWANFQKSWFDFLEDTITESGNIFKTYFSK